MEPLEIVFHLRRLPMFQRLTTAQLIELAAIMREESHPPSTVVVREGDYDACMYLIVDGVVQITKGDTVLTELGSRHFFGEMAVFEGGVRSATVITKTRVRLLRLERVELLRLMEELPGIAINVCQALSQRVRQLSERLVEGQSKQLEDDSDGSG